MYGLIAYCLLAAIAIQRLIIMDLKPIPIYVAITQSICNRARMVVDGGPLMAVVAAREIGTLAKSNS